MAKKKPMASTYPSKMAGTVIEYEDEDIEIHRRYEAELQRLGTRCGWASKAYQQS